MTRSRLLVTVLAGLLAGCGSAVPDARDANRAPAVTGDGGEPGLADIELCDAPDYRSMIGTSIAAVTLPEGPRLRAFAENDIVTQEFIPQRTNVVFDDGGKIIRVYCG